MDKLAVKKGLKVIEVRDSYSLENEKLPTVNAWELRC